MRSRVGGSEAEMSRSESHFTRLTVCVPATSLKSMMIANPFYSASSYRHVNGHTAAATGEVKV